MLTAPRHACIMLRTDNVMEASISSFAMENLDPAGSAELCLDRDFLEITKRAFLAATSSSVLNKSRYTFFNILKGVAKFQISNFSIHF